MYDFNSMLFWYKFIFLVELISGYMLLISRLRLKKGILWRAAVLFAAMFAVAFAIPILAYNALFLSGLMLFLFVLVLFGSKFCLDENWSTVIFVGLFAYTVQHISYQLYTLICNLLNVGGNIYANSVENAFDWLSALVFISAHVFIYVISWAVLTYRLRNLDTLVINRNRLILLSVFILLADVILNAVVVYGVPSASKIALNIFAVYNILSCVFALFVQFLMLSEEHYETELKIVESLWQKDKERYELSKENIEIINTKCHDLRHRIRAARSRPIIDEQELAEIEKAVNIYEEHLDTGNKVVDVIIAEESFYCRNNDIKLICMIDGKRLSFMHKGDVYSLLQNGIHNAIDAVSAVEDEDKRVVRVMIKQVDEMVSIHVENYYDDKEEIIFENGLPKTKKDKNYHGFGMRSIKMICEKYGGSVLASAEDGIFNLDMIIPTPRELTDFE
ncbi:MAG: GHKL domain-containing protein [Clostridia bacterium]|jgi:hypothetical protein|nr:GHKL domain-containing protein [Clostridia bacterium]